MAKKKQINIFRTFEKLLKEYVNDLIVSGYYIDYEGNNSFAKYAKYIYNQMSDYERSKISLTDSNKKGYIYNYVLTKYVILRTDSQKYKEYVQNLFSKLFTNDKWWLLKENVIYILNHKYFKRNNNSKDVIYIVNKIIHRNRVYVLFPSISKDAIIKLNKNNIDKLYQEVKRWTSSRNEFSEFEKNSLGEKTYQFSYLLNTYETKYEENISVRIEFDASQYKDEMFDELSKYWLLLYEFEPKDINNEQNKIEKEIERLLKKDYSKELNEIKSRIKYYQKKLLFLNHRMKVSLKLNNKIQSIAVFNEMTNINIKLSILNKEYKKLLLLDFVNKNK